MKKAEVALHLTAAAIPEYAQRVAALKQAHPLAADPCGAVLVGLPPKHFLPVRHAVTAVRKPEPARQRAAAVLAALGAHARAKPVPRQASLPQVKLAAIAVVKQGL